MPMKRIPPPGSHPGGGPGPAGTPCTERLHVARRTSSTIHIHPPRRSTPACDGRTRGRPAHKRSVTDMAKCVSPGVPVHGGDNKPDHANLGAVGRKLTGEQRAPSLGRSGGVGPLCVNFPSANGRQLSTIIMEFWFRQVHQTHRVPSDHPQIHDLAWFYGF